MINKLDYRKCTICQSCVNVCPKNCINLNEVKEGFNYPTIDKDVCIECKMCERVCPIINPLEVSKSLKKIYAAKNLNEVTRFKSSSGGIFTALSEVILGKDGVVCGAAFNNLLEVKHVLIDNRSDLELLRGSKYVQSDINNSFSLIKKELLKGKEVLFSGCPCQVGGLKKFLNNEYSNLYTIDFICHSIPSQYIFNQYINMLENEFKSRVIKFSFRDKTNGWHNSSIKAIFENGEIYIKSIYEDMYMRGFLGNVYTKSACNHCEFRGLKSGSDITLADFWGAEIEENELDDNKGLSIVITNSKKANLLIEDIKEKVLFKSTNFDNAIKYNQSIFKSSNSSKDKEKFFYMAKNKGYDKAFKYYCKEKRISRYTRTIRGMMGKIKKCIIK